MIDFLLSLIPGGGATVAGWLLAFLGAFVTAAAKGFVTEQGKIGALQDKGAADQRTADQAADDAAVARAKGKDDAAQKANDDGLDRDLRGWVLPE